jgi:hypothetical protein
MLNHHDVVVARTGDHEFVATVLGDLTISGNWAAWDDKVLAVVAVTNTD